jgi:hypothetical protein
MLKNEWGAPILLAGLPLKAQHEMFHGQSLLKASQQIFA